MARRLHLITALVATVVLSIAMTMLANFPILDTMWRATAGEIYESLSARTASQLDRYRVMLVIDFFYAIAYTGLFLALLRRFKSNERFRGVVFLAGTAAALLAGVADCVENTGTLAILAALPEQIPIARILGTVTTTKWLAIGGAAIAVGMEVGVHVLRREHR